MSRKSQSRRGAFTLVELMIVIIIIGILAGLLSVAAYNAVLAARKTRVKAEIDSLHMALQQYTTERGEAPPCFGVANTPQRQTQREDQIMAHLRKAFPRFTIVPNSPPEPLSYSGPSGNTGLKKYVQSNFGRNIDDIDQAEALVFWLGGPPAPTGTASTKLLGWSADVSNPFKPTGARASGGFAFDESRLVDLDQDGWWEYIPAVTSSAGPTPPYVYYDSGSYTSPLLRSYLQSYPAQASKYFPPKTPYSNLSFWGIALPYVSKLPPNSVCVNPQTFQIISAGLDSAYGDAGVATQRLALFPTGTNYTEGDQDNLTNFSEGTLKDAIP
jgi:prepilin-type N-terminal cleavage/methylation domain-containing protein